MRATCVVRAWAEVRRHALLHLPRMRHPLRRRPRKGDSVREATRLRLPHPRRECPLRALPPRLRRWSPGPVLAADFRRVARLRPCRVGTAVGASRRPPRPLRPSLRRPSRGRPHPRPRWAFRLAPTPPRPRGPKGAGEGSVPPPPSHRWIRPGPQRPRSRHRPWPRRRPRWVTAVGASHRRPPWGSEAPSRPLPPWGLAAEPWRLRPPWVSVGEVSRRRPWSRPRRLPWPRSAVDSPHRRWSHRAR